jgi:hypothetical protein
MFFRSDNTSLIIKGAALSSIFVYSFKAQSPPGFLRATVIKSRVILALNLFELSVLVRRLYFVARFIKRRKRLFEMKLLHLIASKRAMLVNSCRFDAISFLSSDSRNDL